MIEETYGLYRQKNSLGIFVFVAILSSFRTKQKTIPTIIYVINLSKLCLDIIIRLRADNKHNANWFGSKTKQHDSCQQCIE